MRYQLRDKLAEMAGLTLEEIAEIILDLEDEKADLTDKVSDLTMERDDLASRVPE